MLSRGRPHHCIRISRPHSAAPPTVNSDRFHRPLEPRFFWAAHVTFWAVAFAAGMVVAKAFVPDVPNTVWFIGSRVGAGFMFSALLRWLSVRDDLRRRFGFSQAGLMLGGPVAGGVAITLLAAALAWFRDAPPATLGLWARLVLNTFALAAWSAAYFGFHLLREGQSNELRAFEAESLASKNELKLLQSQISPHFLFNALNTILACKNNPEAIETVTHSLASYLRFLLRPSGSLEPLGREIDALEEYLTIQSFRFGDRLSCSIDCDADIRGIPVIPVMIQPLVENALKHGVSGDQPLTVTVRAWREADRLFVEVANTGRWVQGDRRTSPGTGLEALRRRLFLHAGPTATVTTRESEGWVRALLTIPLAAAYADPRPALRTAAAPEPSPEPAR
jgi:hypothetical protein